MLNSSLVSGEDFQWESDTERQAGLPQPTIFQGHGLYLVEMPTGTWITSWKDNDKDLG